MGIEGFPLVTHHANPAVTSQGPVAGHAQVATGSGLPGLEGAVIHQAEAVGPGMRVRAVEAEEGRGLSPQCLATGAADPPLPASLAAASVPGSERSALRCAGHEEALPCPGTAASPGQTRSSPDSASIFLLG